MKAKVLIYTLMSLLVACGETLSKMPWSESAAKEADGRAEERVIYGDDNRVENYQASQALRTLAASTVALVKNSELSIQRGLFVIGGENFGSSYNLCASEPFREQTSGAFCSGSLVGPNLVMTAGHCITNSTDCANTSFVFDFALTSPRGETRSFAKNLVYSCSRILKRELENSGADYALIELDRPVSERSPLKVRRSGSVSVGDSLVVIGHPAGLPQKIAGGATVRSVQARHFVTNLDTYGGNSGSAVFNAVTFEIEGILVRGENDFVSQGNCNVSNRCAASSCRGEDVTRIDQLASYIPDIGSPEEPPASSEIIFSSSEKLGIPDYPAYGIESLVQASQGPLGRQVLVKVNIEHTYRGDLRILLIAPTGKSLSLHKRTGGSLDHLIGIFGSSLASADPLNELSQIAQAGTWKLKIIDEASRDVGVLKDWSLIFR